MSGGPSTWIPARTRERIHALRQRVVARFVEEPYSSVLPYTMVGMRRLRTLRRLALSLDADQVPGDIVECGTCNGGSGALLAKSAGEGSRRRHVWLLDSFQGLPPAGPLDGREAGDWTGLCHGSVLRVREALARLQVDPATVTIASGWFADTLPTLAVDRVALLHIDADWYESVTQVLEALFDRVSVGGYVVFDDYGFWEGCARAWQDFSARRTLRLDAVDIDGTGAYVRVV